MTATAKPGLPPTPQSTVRPPRNSLSVMLIWAIVLATLAMSWQGADMRPMDLLRDSGNMAKFAADFFPPDFRDWHTYLD